MIVCHNVNIHVIFPDNSENLLVLVIELCLLQTCDCYGIVLNMSPSLGTNI